MNTCESIRAQMTFYLDDELRNGEATELEMHLADCLACREVFDNERRFLDSLRACSPLHIAPNGLRAKVEEVLSDVPSSRVAPAELRNRIKRLLIPLRFSTSALVTYRNVIAAIGLVAIVMLGIWYGAIERKAPSDFAMMAIYNHQRHLRGELKLETGSNEPEEISKWFDGKVPFEVRLPNYQESSGQERLYELEGARLVSYGTDHAAYVAYQMHKRPISLLMTSDAVAHASGGEQVISQGITFHCDSINGLKVISWSDRGLTYALVSDLEERGQESCIVCHQGTKDRDFIQELKP